MLAINYDKRINLFKILGYQIENNIWEKNNEKMKMFKPNLCTGPPILCPRFLGQYIR